MLRMTSSKKWQVEIGGSVVVLTVSEVGYVCWDAKTLAFH